MSGIGPVRLPTTIKALKGTLRPCRENPNEPAPPEGDLVCPDHLTDAEKRAWAYYIPVLEKMGLDSPAEAGVLELLAIARARRLEAQRQYRAEGEELVVTSEKGTIKVNPLITIIETAALQEHKFLCEIGLTPAARAKVVPRKKQTPKESDPYDRPATG